MTDSQIDALIEMFQARMQKVVDEYLKRMGQQVRVRALSASVERGEINFELVGVLTDAQA